MANGTRYSRSVVLLAALALVGCNARSSFDVAPVAGRVTLDGKPVRGAMVQFIPSSERADRAAGHYSRGITDESGRYTLSTVERDSQDGAVVGNHQVVVSTFRMERDPSNPEKTVVVSEETIPAPYNDYRVSPLVFTVEPGGTDLADIALTRKAR